MKDIKAGTDWKKLATGKTSKLFKHLHVSNVVDKFVNHEQAHVLNMRELLSTYPAKQPHISTC